ncbi:MAG: DUF805 domain-containing protein [Planctomycetota bacterium]|jgi:uncharacterized membrane protein YhaH (DUF805 family)|nr:DUF805 domain-containing protein [Planctomycetota bacterium]
MDAANQFYIDVLKTKYAAFDGRARRKEYWMYVLFNAIAAVAAMIIDNIIGFPFFYILYGLAVLVPSIAISVRRLHDIGKSGWWIIIALVPLVGVVILFVFSVMEGQKGQNQYGPDPKA